MKPIADTGLLVGFLDSADQYHAWAKEQFGRLRQALTTCEAVIAETEYLVPGSGPLLMEMVGRGTLQIVSLLPREAGPIGAQLKQYPKMQFADACVFHLSATISDAIVYTTDKRDFSIYRRRRTKVVRMITP